MNVKLLVILFVCVIMASSCIGVSADISIRADGSGRIALEYRVSRMAESLGRLDGNQRWQTVPVGQADLERSVARIPGMRIVSVSSKDDGKDVITRATLEFTNINALLAFLDASGEYAAYSEGSTNRLKLMLLDRQDSALDPDLLSLLRELSQTYEVRLNFNMPAAASLSLCNSAGEKIEPPSAGDQSMRIISPGRRVSFSTGIGELFSLTQGLGVEIVW